jgi:GNAT superfamily N-acetyltransferase
MPLRLRLIAAAFCDKIATNLLLTMRFLQASRPHRRRRRLFSVAMQHISIGQRFAGIGADRREKTPQARAARRLESKTMYEPLPDGSVVRKLWIGETDAYRDHLLRLDRESRRRRFSGTVADEVIARHAATANEVDVVVHGFFVDGVLRGAAELRPIGPLFAHEAEAAFSIEQPWQSLGVGTVLLRRTLLSARNRGIKSLRMYCLADNQRMQQLARKFDAELSFDFGSVVGEVDPPRSTALSLLREAVADGHSIANAIIEAQLRLFQAA